MIPESQPFTTVFFDGGCPLCSREIAHYRRLNARSEIDWIDVTREPDRLAVFDLTAEDAMRSFHVMDKAGQMVTGARAFITLWRELPYYRRLAALCEALRVLPLLEWGYRHFARWHFQNRCAKGICR